ncbi:unnamed protein product [Mytilus coruscus]|uniref:Uncharacterized protein n=1 Tax=Mytilus coruscus TaxID=42192 RepID=A0A6J8AZT2_MYTCO|nr:unnamed protein product [Mytilus coruscus]
MKNMRMILPFLIFLYLQLQNSKGNDQGFEINVRFLENGFITALTVQFLILKKDLSVITLIVKTSTPEYGQFINDSNPMTKIASGKVSKEHVNSQEQEGIVIDYIDNICQTGKSDREQDKEADDQNSTGYDEGAGITSLLHFVQDFWFTANKNEAAEISKEAKRHLSYP